MVPAMQLTQVALDVAPVELDDFPAMHKHKRKTVSTLMHRLRVLRGWWGGWLMMWCLRGKTRSTKRRQWSPRSGLGETRVSDEAT